jgi:hypothetical protein
MDKVGLFIVDKLENENIKNVIFSKFLEIVSENNMNEILFFENEEGLDVMYVFLNIRFQEKIFRLFKTYNVLKDYQQLDCDSVLDKILSEGINSLNDADFKILGK